MTHNLGRHTERFATEIANSTNSEIRQFYVPTTAVLTGPTADLQGQKWQSANPKSVLDFTVIGYFFAKKLYEKYHVPMGIINTCVGGTPIEAWISESGFKDYADILQKVSQNKDTAYVNGINREAKAVNSAGGNPPLADRGLTENPKWYETSYAPKNWKTLNVPGYWENQGIRGFDGVMWYRREIEVPASMTGVDARIKLGRIVNADECYVNGQRVGGTGYEYPQREYPIAAGILKPGKNLIVVRVTNQYGNGGFVSDKPYFLLAAGDTIDLKGDWQTKVGEIYLHDKPYKSGINAQNEPTSLYNGMVAPYTSYAVRGVLWYQGESNAGNPEAYKKLLPSLIADWRTQWQQPTLAFYIAQLPAYMDIDYLPVQSNWARMREIQAQTAEQIPNTATSVNIDLGEWNDIHPGNKKPVGERLALAAIKLSYADKTILSTGPSFKSAKIEGNKIIVSFNNVGSGLVSSNGEALAHFAIAGADKKFRWATATIVGNEVVVSSETIDAPQFVRYAWADNPDFANLANKEGMPAAPFRTDQ
jgi:sialate O-acetylesterase